MAKIRKRTRDGRTTWLADHRDGSGAHDLTASPQGGRPSCSSPRRSPRLGPEPARCPSSTSETVAHAGQLWFSAVRGERTGAHHVEAVRRTPEPPHRRDPQWKCSVYDTPGIEAFGQLFGRQMCQFLPLAANSVYQPEGYHRRQAQRRGLAASKNVAAPVKIVSRCDEERANIPGKEELRLMLDVGGLRPPGVLFSSPPC